MGAEKETEKKKYSGGLDRIPSKKHKSRTDNGRQETQRNQPDPIASSRDHNFFYFFYFLVFGVYLPGDGKMIYHQDDGPVGPDGLP